MNSTMPSLNSTLIGVTAVRKHPIYSFYYQNLTRFALLGLLPMLLLIILNVRVFSAIQARKSTCRDASYAHILLLVVLVFLLCQSPRLFLNFWELFLDLECGPPVWYQMLHVISNWLIALNSATNFFIYCLAGAKFRQGLAVMLGCRSPTPIGPPSTSHTAVDLKSYTTKLWPEVKSFTKVQSGKSQCNSLKMSGMELGMWNTRQEFVPQSESSTMMWASAWY